MILLSILSTSNLSALNSVNRVYKLVMVSRFHSTWKAICMDTAGSTTSSSGSLQNSKLPTVSVRVLSQSGNPQAHHLQLPSHWFLCRGSVEGAAVGTAAHCPKLLPQRDPRVPPIRKKCSKFKSMLTLNLSCRKCSVCSLLRMRTFLPQKTALTCSSERIIQRMWVVSINTTSWDSSEISVLKVLVHGKVKGSSKISSTPFFPLLCPWNTAECWKWGKNNLKLQDFWDSRSPTNGLK